MEKTFWPQTFYFPSKLPFFSKNYSLVMHEVNTAVFSKMFQECVVNKIMKSFLSILT